MAFTSIYVDALIFGYIKNRNTVFVIQNGIRGGDCNGFPILHTIKLIQISPRSGTWQIWKKSLAYLYPRIQALHQLKPSEVLSSLYTFQFPSRKPFNIQSTPVFLFGAILEGVWKHYWRYIFDSIPLVPDQVVFTIIQTAHTYLNKN